MCEECGRVFTDENVLLRHRLTHRACPHCSKTFANKKNLVRHTTKCESYMSKSEDKDEAMKPYLNSYHHLFQLRQIIHHHLQEGIISEQVLTGNQKNALHLFRHWSNIQRHSRFTVGSQI